MVSNTIIDMENKIHDRTGGREDNMTTLNYEIGSNTYPADAQHKHKHRLRLHKQKVPDVPPPPPRSPISIRQHGHAKNQENNWTDKINCSMEMMYRFGAS